MQPAREQVERHVDGRQEEDQEDRHLHRRTGLERPRPHRHAGREQRRGERDQVGEQDQRDQVDAVAADPHAGRQRDREQQRAHERRPRQPHQRVAGQDREPVRRRQQQAPREAVLEVGGDPEAGEHAAERRRLQEHEHELERRVAGREVEPRHLAEPRQPARERGEEEQREDQRRQQVRRVGDDVVERPPRDGERDLRVPPHVRTSLVRRAVAAPNTPSAAIASATPKPSAIASPSHPVTMNERIPSIR